jgi:hypothetical protein
MNNCLDIYAVHIPCMLRAIYLILQKQSKTLHVGDNFFQKK